MYTLTDNRWLQINKHRSWHMFSSSRFAEKRTERVVSTAKRLVRWHLEYIDLYLVIIKYEEKCTYMSVWLDAML